MGCTESKPQLTAERIVEGLKAALDLATRETIKVLSQPGGFMNNPSLHIPVPGTLGTVLEKVKPIPGIGDQANNFERKLNEAAEAAAGAVYDIFANCINRMNFSDAKAILEGANDAATTAFRQFLGADILARFAPIVKAKMNEVGVVSAFQTIADTYEKIPFVGSKVEFDIYDYTVTKAFDGFFATLAQMESAVRNTPAMRANSQVLQDVFGQRK